MKANLHEQWSSRDDRRLGKQSVSTRLPVHILARIAAITDMYDSRKRSDVITALLNAGLETFEADLEEAGQGDPLFAQRVIYRELSNKHYMVLEKELGAEPKEPLFPKEK